MESESKRLYDRVHHPVGPHQISDNKHTPGQPEKDPMHPHQRPVTPGMPTAEERAIALEELADNRAESKKMSEEYE